MSIAPVVFDWDGDAMVPIQHHRRLADKQFVVGEQYKLVPHESRSINSHNHFFASVHEGWSNLPEIEAERFPSADHLRRWCLIKAGYADERSIVCASHADALRVAAFIKPMDQFAVVVANGNVVKVFTAQSQSMKAMGAKEFQKSKEAVLDIIAGMIGVSPDALGKARAA